MLNSFFISSVVIIICFYCPMVYSAKGLKRKQKTHVGMARGPARRRMRQKTCVLVPHWTIEVQQIYYYYYYAHWYFIPRGL